MTRSSIFWMLMILWALFGIGIFVGPPTYSIYIRGGFTLFQFALFALLGWQVYGPAIKGG